MPDTITTTRVNTPDGTVLEVYSASGEKRTTVKQVSHTRTVMTVRPLKWYEHVWLWAKKLYRWIF